MDASSLATAAAAAAAEALNGDNNFELFALQRRLRLLPDGVAVCRAVYRPTESTSLERGTSTRVTDVSCVALQ